METVIELAKVKNLFSYEDYKKFVIECSEKNATTGNEQLPERIEATKINAQRMKRIDKQIELNVKTISMIINFNEKWKWIVLAESWCGDGLGLVQQQGPVASLLEMTVRAERVFQTKIPAHRFGVPYR